MIENILGTGAKVKIMKVLHDFPSAQFQAVDIARKAGLSVSRTSECLKELVDYGILQSKKIGKGYLFDLDMSNYVTRIILDLFKKEKKLVYLVADDFVSRVKKAGKIASIVLFGSALRELRTDSDIDFLVVYEGEIDEGFVRNIDVGLQEKWGFPVSSLLMSAKEFKTKAKNGEDFVISVMAGGKVVFGKDMEDI